MQTVQQEHGKKLDAIEKMRLKQEWIQWNELRMDATEAKNATRHSEIMDRFNSLGLDQDFILEKAARNEREPELIKRGLS
jgi:hypothetical protein